MMDIQWMIYLLCRTLFPLEIGLNSFEVLGKNASGISRNGG